MKTIWFKRRLYGWGWYPATWQGWVVIGVYLILMLIFAFTLDENASRQDVDFTFILPVILLTVSLLLICLRKGERPRWQWGTRIEDEEDK